MAELDSEALIYNYNSPSLALKKLLPTGVNKRLSDVLFKILDNSYYFCDDTILDKLYSHLDVKAKEDEFMSNTIMPWLVTVLEEWDKLKKNVKTFALKMIGTAASCEKGLKHLIASKLLFEFSNAVRCGGHENDVSVTLAFMEMLHEVVKTVEGSLWFLSLGLFEYTLIIYYCSQSIYLTRKTKQVIITLVLVLEKVELETCWTVIDLLLAPLNVAKLSNELPHSRQEMLMGAQIFVNNNSSCETFGEDLMTSSSKFDVDFQNDDLVELAKESIQVENDKILPTVQLLCSLVDTALLERECSSRDINIILKNYNLYLWSWEKLASCENHNSKLIGSLSSLILYIIYSTMSRIEENNVAEGDIRDTLKSFLFLIQALTSKRQYLTINNICVQSQMLADKLISTPVYLCKEDGVTYNFQAQILFLHALPIFIFLKLARITHADVADKFADKLFTLTSISVKRVCYQYRDTLRVCPQCCNREELLRSSVQTLIGILKYLNKDQVVVVFQSLMHLLREFVPDEYTYMNKVVMLESFELVQRYPKLLMDVLDGLEITIKNYNITWSESLETSCVLVLLMSLSCISDLTVPLSTKLLRLIHLAISNFIPPNLALLVENFKNSSLELLGPLLMRKLHDIHWEVRDSTLEVLQTLSFLSVLKFPAFQNLLLELNFPTVIIGMFECDEESYVRSSAIVCLQKMVQVKRLWEEALVDKNLLEKMLKCLKSEPEGIVRKEAANLITDIFINHDICVTVMQDVYRQLLFSATSDLHWEVKLNALTFWDAVIDRETANQGMIDGTFPAVTFSKASRKIVTLTPSEIQKRLKVVLDVLETHGCLQVLWMALNDMSDLEVARKCATIISKLVKLLQQYGVVEDTCGRASVVPQLMSLTDGRKISNCYNQQPWSSLDLDINLMEEHNHHKNDEQISDNYDNVDVDELMFGADEIIKSIMDTQDIELVSTVYNYSNNNKIDRGKEGEEELGKDEKEVVTRAQLQPHFISWNEFIDKVTSLNLESVIKVRSEWITASEELDSLIDDILAVSQDKNPTADSNNCINAKDCY